MHPMHYHKHRQARINSQLFVCVIPSLRLRLGSINIIFSSLQLLLLCFFHANLTFSWWFWVVRESTSSLCWLESFSNSWLCFCFSSSMWIFISSMRWCRLSASWGKKELLYHWRAIQKRKLLRKCCYCLNKWTVQYYDKFVLN